MGTCRCVIFIGVIIRKLLYGQTRECNSLTLFGSFKRTEEEEKEEEQDSLQT